MQGKTLAKRVGRFSLATLISRILGYLRDASVAHIFGGEMLTDTFYTAFRISNLLRRLLGEGALSSSFIPVFSKSVKNEPHEEVQNFLNALFTTLFTVLVILTVMGILFAPQLNDIIAPGFKAQPEKYRMTVLLTRWTFPFFLFISLAALLSGVLNSLKHFFLPAVAPAMLSVAEIGYLFLFLPLAGYAAWRLTPEQQLVGLSIAAVLGGLGHLLVQLPMLFKENFHLKFRWQWKHPHSVQVFKLMLPAMIGLSVDQINAFVDTIVATTLVDGSVTALYNSNRLMQLPLALFGIAIASVSLPTMADFTAESRHQHFAESLNEALRMVVFTVAPAALGLMMLSKPVVRLLFQHGRFSEHATLLTSQALWGYTFGLVAYSSVKVLANSFYALQEPKVPVRNAAFCMVLNVILIFLMRRWGVLGLSLAAAFASWTNALSLFYLMRKRLRPLCDSFLESAGPHSLFVTLGKTALACLGMGLFLYWVTHGLAHLRPLWQVLIGVLGGVGIYFILSKILGIEERHFVRPILGLKENIED